jgi:hypothetical protein
MRLKPIAGGSQPRSVGEAISMECPISQHDGSRMDAIKGFKSVRWRREFTITSDFMPFRYLVPDIF